jgi:hypothetical protein
MYVCPACCFAEESQSTNEKCLRAKNIRLLNLHSRQRVFHGGKVKVGRAQKSFAPGAGKLLKGVAPGSTARAHHTRVLKSFYAWLDLPLAAKSCAKTILGTQSANFSDDEGYQVARRAKLWSLFMTYYGEAYNWKSGYLSIIVQMCTQSLTFIHGLKIALATIVNFCKIEINFARYLLGIIL